MIPTETAGGLTRTDHHPQDQPGRGLARTLGAGAAALVAAIALAAGAAGFAGAQSTTPTTPADPPAQTAPGDERERDCPEEEGGAGGGDAAAPGAAGTGADAAFAL